MDKKCVLTRAGIGWRWFFAALVVMVLLVQTTTVSAHPADMFFQDHQVHLTPEGMEIEWTIYPGPMLVYAIWQYVDQDADGQVSGQEASIWVEDILSWFSAEIDESISLDLQIDAIDWPSSVEALQLGDELIIVSLSAVWPEDLHGSHSLRLYDQHQESTSTFWFLLAAEGGVSFEKPVQQDGMLNLNMDIPAGEADPADEMTFRLVKWDSGIPEIPASDGSVVPPDAEDQPASPQPKSLLSESLQKVQNLLRAPALSTGFILNAILISLFLGAIHALTPGHGKALVAAYLVGMRGTTLHALILSGIVTLTHTGSVLAFGLVTLLASRYIFPTDLFPYLEVFSGLLIISIGVPLLWRRWKGFRAVRRGRREEPMPAVDAQGDGGAVPEKKRIEVGQKIDTRPFDDLLPVDKISLPVLEKINWRSLITLGVGGGVVPCPDAIAILLVAVTLNRIFLGLLLVTSFSLGLALVLTGIGIAVVRGRSVVQSTDRLTRMAPGLAMLSAVIVIGIGMFITIKAVLQNDFSGTLSPKNALTASMEEDGGYDAFLYIAQDDEEFLQLFSRSLVGDEIYQLSEQPAGIYNYALSPDEMSIAYFAPNPTGSDLWLLSRANGETTHIFECEEVSCHSPVWSPDGTQIVYIQILENQATTWWYDLTTDTANPVLQNSLAPIASVGWSPEGTWLSYYISTTKTIELYQLEDGTRHSIGNQKGAAVCWLPDEGIVFFTDLLPAEKLYINHLYRYDLETREVVDLTVDMTLDDGMAFCSPDGKWIATIRRQVVEDYASLPNYEVWLVRPDGSEAYPITASPSTLYTSLVWSPDSDFLLTQQLSLEEPFPKSEIWLVDLEQGTHELIVTPGQVPVWIREK